MDIFAILKLAKENASSDIHIVSAMPPMIRVHGKLQPVPGYPVLDPRDTEDAFFQISSPEQRSKFDLEMELDFGMSPDGVGRVRCNVARQQGTVSLVMRLLPDVIPSIAELGLPEICKDLSLRPRGLVVISGPTGSG
ncbi:MAG: type IV pili twitching motility protein PilT, partial [Dehalococcoidia bacterium]|nr:type IV pili twitching motility protein PilT [Dehalococcoidia bacterium]